MLRSQFRPGRDYALAILAALGFVWISLTIPDSGPTALDAAVRGVIHSWASDSLTSAMKVATQFGGGWFLFPFGALITWMLYRAGRRRDAVIFVVAVLGANLIDEGMKLIFHRPRPLPWFEYPEPITYSFPSGHSFVSFCFYLSLAEILIGDEWPAARKAAMWTAAAICTLTIGFSRAYLGVHYPTDVLGGYVAAVAWTTMVRVAHHMYWLPGGEESRKVGEI